MSETSADDELSFVQRTESDRLLDGVAFARVTLEAGVTTVRDLGGDTASILALREATADGRTPGPRIVASGESLSITGGHGDVHGYRAGLIKSPETVCDSADACRAAVRALVKHGVDVIKLNASGGVMSNVGSGLGRQFTDVELKAIVEEAHNFGLKVAAHAHGPEGINAALRAGADSIEHGTFLNDESLALFKRTKAYLVPTMLTGRTVVSYAKEGDFLPPAIREKALAVEPVLKTFVRRAHDAGVRIAFGTDVGVAKHGRNADELFYLVESGLTTSEALRAATINAADLLGLSSEIGALRAGMAADIIAVSGDPLQDVAAMKQVRFVMKAGRVAKALDAPAPAD